MAEELRTARAQIVVSAGVGGVVPLPLPMLEGQIIVPEFGTVMLNIEDSGNDVTCGLSWNRSLAAPGVAESAVTDPSVWWMHGFGSEQSFDMDFRGKGFELGGPQTFWYFNGVASTRICSIILHYSTKQVDLLRWARIAKRTSYED